MTKTMTINGVEYVEAPAIYTCEGCAFDCMDINCRKTPNCDGIIFVRRSSVSETIPTAPMTDREKMQEALQKASQLFPGVEDITAELHMRLNGTEDCSIYIYPEPRKLIYIGCGIDWDRAFENLKEDKSRKEAE